MAKYSNLTKVIKCEKGGELKVLGKVNEVFSAVDIVERFKDADLSSINTKSDDCMTL